MDEEYGAEAADENAGRGEEAEDAVDDAVIAADGAAAGESGEAAVAGDDGHSMDHLTVVMACAFVQRGQTVEEGHGDAEEDVIDDGEEEGR